MIAIREVTLSDYSTLKNVVDTCSEQSEYINKLDEEFAKDVVTKPFKSVYLNNNDNFCRECSK